MKRILIALGMAVVCVVAGLYVGTYDIQTAQAQISETNIVRSPGGRELVIGNLSDLRVWGEINFDDDDSLETLANTFSLTVDSAFMDLSSAGAVTSDSTTAVNDGSKDRTFVLLRNGGSYNITLKNSANTDLGTGDITLGATDWIALMWIEEDSLWERVFNTDN